MDEATKTAFSTPWALCSAEQRALRERHLPTLPPFEDRDDYLVNRFNAGLPMSISAKRDARRIIKQRQS
jgi:hypothetical protein